MNNQHNASGNYNSTDVLTVCLAVHSDAEIICNIRDKCWLGTYPNETLGITAEQILLNAQGKDGVFVPRRIEYLKNHLSNNGNSADVTFVAKIGDQVVGYVNPSKINNHNRINALYVDPDSQAKGIGTALMRQALSWVGSGNVFLEVVSYNTKAINFYRKFGFEPSTNLVEEESGRPDYMTSLPQMEMVKYNTPSS